MSTGFNRSMAYVLNILVPVKRTFVGKNLDKMIDYLY